MEKRKKKRMEIPSIEEIAMLEAPKEDYELFGLQRLQSWIEGFKAGYLHKRTESRNKPVDVYYKGHLVRNAKSLTEAYMVSGVSNSHISRLMRTKQKTKTGYKFKPGK